MKKKPVKKKPVNGNGKRDLMAVTLKQIELLRVQTAELTQTVDNLLATLPKVGKGTAPQTVFDLSDALQNLATATGKPSSAVSGYINQHAMANGKFEPGRMTAIIQTSTRVSPQWKQFALTWGKELFREDETAIEKRARDATEPSSSRSVKIVETTAA